VAILLHGFAGDPQVWAGFEGEAIAMPGHGLPIRDSWQANLDAIDTHGATLAIGYSFGARVALGLLADRRIERAILIGVNPGISDDERPARRAADARWAQLLRERGIEAFLAAWEAQPLFATQQRVPERVAARRAWRSALDPEQLARCLETMGLAEMPDYRGVVGRATLIAGADDAKFLLLGGDHVIAIPGAGHDVLLEQPEALAAVLTRITRAGDPESSPDDPT
jgi:pimeloyl-ACP methyl ester carboxylesterase